MELPAEPVPLRRQLYPLLIVVAVAMVVSRILAVTMTYEPYLYHDQPTGKDDPQTGLRYWPDKRPLPVPTFGSNDRSRWATIRALVDDGTYVVGYREDIYPTGPNLPNDPWLAARTVGWLGAPQGQGPLLATASLFPGRAGYRDSGIITEDGWKSVDKVLRPESDLDDPNRYRFYSSKPPLLPTLLAGEYWLLKQVFGLSLKNPADVWIIVRVILLTVNALPLTIFLVLLARQLERYGGTDWGRLFVLAAACFGTFLTLYAIALNNHTVGACFAFYSLCAALRIWRVPASGPLWYVLTGSLAAFTTAVELPAAALLGLLFLLLLWRNPWPTLYGFLPAVVLVAATALYTNYQALGTWKPAYSEANPEGPDTGFWYKYKGSVWRKDAPDEEVPKRGPDFARRQGETEAEYVFHCLLGHHGVFSLTPIWLFAVAGMVYGVRRFGKLPTVQASETPLADNEQPLIAGLALILTVVVLGFYLWRTNNYSGVSNGLRWLFWLIPFWLLSMVPIVDRLATHRWGRALGYALLALSVLSASYRDWNPWRHPWLWQLMQAEGWLPY